MEKQILVAGFGGQGVLSIGLFLTHSALMEGHNVSWLPSYGAEMRGGTANCMVTIADEAICSPLTDYPMHAIIMNRPSLDRFETKVKPGGFLVLNTSLVDREVEREDLQVLKIPVTKTAEEMGFAQAANMVILGAFIVKSKVVEVDSAIKCFETVFKGKKSKNLERNRSAFMAGIEYANKNW